MEIKKMQLGIFCQATFGNKTRLKVKANATTAKYTDGSVYSEIDGLYCTPI